DACVLNKLLPNRSKHTLSSHLEKIPLEERKRVLYVTIDMWEPYKQVSLKYFPNCTISVDPFHIVKHLSDNFTKFRVSLMNQDTIVSFASR
ncbi:MAG: transposase, partial [Bulleidia sp.]|nr:transposase [Bulleidia sp.]